MRYKRLAVDEATLDGRDSGVRDVAHSSSREADLTITFTKPGPEQDEDQPRRQWPICVAFLLSLPCWVLLIWLVSTWNPGDLFESSLEAAATPSRNVANLTNATGDSTSTAAPATTTRTRTTTATTMSSTTSTSSTRVRVDALCVTVLRVHSYKGYELELLRRQLKGQTGVFACRRSLVLTNKRVQLSDADDPPTFSTIIDSDPDDTGDGVTTKHENEDLFRAVWDGVQKDGGYKRVSWIVKLDPQTVFFAERLSEQLRGMDPEEPVYFANCRDEEHEPYMFGALEVFSRAALERYFSGLHACDKLKGMWEDRFMQRCLSTLHVRKATDLVASLLADAHCGGEGPVPMKGHKLEYSGPCRGHFAAFSSLRTPGTYFRCWGEARAQG